LRRPHAASVLPRTARHGFEETAVVKGSPDLLESGTEDEMNLRPRPYADSPGEVDLR
jgi:hypothetical protein